MKITLTNMQLENFKGLKSWGSDFNDESTVIKAENGVGKTTVFDAVLYLLFGKDSTGRKDFELRPLDGDNQPIKGLVTSVQGKIRFDGVEHTLKK